MGKKEPKPNGQVAPLPAEPTPDPKEKPEDEEGTTRNYVALEIVEAKISGVAVTKAMLIAKEGFAGTREVRKWIATSGKAGAPHRCACLIGRTLTRKVTKVEKSELVEE